jgi:hypothetical protein
VALMVLPCSLPVEAMGCGVSATDQVTGFYPRQPVWLTLQGSSQPSEPGSISCQLGLLTVSPSVMNTWQVL